MTKHLQLRQFIGILTLITALMAFVLIWMQTRDHSNPPLSQLIPNTHLVVSLPPGFEIITPNTATHGLASKCTNTIYASRVRERSETSIWVGAIDELNCMISPDSRMDKDTGWASLPRSGTGQVIYEYYMAPLSIALGIDYDTQPPVVIMTSVGSPSGFSKAASRLVAVVGQTIETSAAPTK